MNLIGKLRKVKINTKSIVFLNKTGNVHGSVPQVIFNEQPDVDIELPRIELVNILYEEVSNDVKFLFGNKITNINEKPENVEALFEDGKTQHYNSGDRSNT